ncbi:MAG TPA: peptidylprolyl isomerase [Terracidiphilus sp.]|nr:peptidylprolyl isomerase [Terracidiphilus sp.]
MKRLLSAFALCAVLVPCALAQAPTSKPHPKTAASRPSTAPHASLLNPASLTAKAPAEFKVSFTTTAGNFLVDVHRDWAPLGADRFYNLVRHGFFTNASFFRVVPSFVVQFGLNADPAINKAWDHATIQDDPVKQSNTRGRLVFATAGPNTRTTQLFINFGDNARLDGMGFAPFGEVIEGIDVVDKINPQYGEQPQQDLITSQGDAYIAKNFPNITRIRLARVLPTTPAHPAAATAAHKPASH